MEHTNRNITPAGAVVRVRTTNGGDITAPLKRAFDALNSTNVELVGGVLPISTFRLASFEVVG